MIIGIGMDLVLDFNTFILTSSYYSCINVGVKFVIHLILIQLPSNLNHALVSSKTLQRDLPV